LTEWPETWNRAGRGVFVPPCDVEETPEHFVLRMDTPGIRKEDLRIELKDDELTISGERKTTIAEESNALRLAERRQGSFERRFVVPAGIPSEKVEANYDQGVLTVVLPKAEATKPRQIQIREAKPA
ncbi:MAG: Hsp20/alpha crystallin family protein, partial [Oligoflexia bacterium]|nr:Hsp20/alpha crystallin family protein [Oligoflexia bacterium]